MMYLPDFSEPRRTRSICVIGRHPGNVGAMLRSKGHNIMEACDPEHALRLVESDRPDMVIIDSGLLDYHEVSLISLLRIRYPHIPVITLSNDGLSADSQIVHHGDDPGESLLTLSRSLIDILQELNQVRSSSHLLNQYA